MKLVHKQLALRKDFEAFALAAIFLQFVKLSHNLQDRVYRQNDQTCSFRFGRKYWESIKNLIAMEMYRKSVVSVTVPSEVNDGPEQV